MTESQKLLDEYVKTGCEVAFRGLLTRYTDLLYSAAVRLVGGDMHLAEDGDFEPWESQHLQGAVAQ